MLFFSRFLAGPKPEGVTCWVHRRPANTHIHTYTLKFTCSVGSKPRELFSDAWRPNWMAHGWLAEVPSPKHHSPRAYPDQPSEPPLLAMLAMLANAFHQWWARQRRVGRGARFRRHGNQRFTMTSNAFYLEETDT